MWYSWKDGDYFLELQEKNSSGQNNGFVLKNLILMLHDIAVSCFIRRFKNLFFTEEIYYATNATASWCGNT
jgi:hypothetical protein